MTVFAWMGQSAPLLPDDNIRARNDGKRLGRPPGKTGRLKLDDQLDVIKGYIAIGLPMAKALGVAYNTLERFIVRKGLEG